MINRSVSARHKLTSRWQGQLTEYITSIACTRDGRAVVASSAAGEVGYWQQDRLTMLLGANGATVDSLSFDRSDRYLAAGGQTGDVRVWDCREDLPKLLLSLPHKSIWIDALAWHPHRPYLAFAIGRFVQIWNVVEDLPIATLDFDLSTVFDLAWHPAGTHLAIAGNLGVRIWRSDDWDADPEFIPSDNAIKQISWSPAGNFLAATTLDRCLLIAEIDELPSSWLLRGFPARIQQIGWLDRTLPTVAAISGDIFVLWVYDGSTWDAIPLDDFHQDFIAAMSVHPTRSLVATASIEGSIAIWEPEFGAIGAVAGSKSDFCQILWHPDGEVLITGSQQGEVTMWGSPKLSDI